MRARNVNDAQRSVEAGISERLKGLGFRRKGQRWGVQRNDVWQVFDLQRRGGTPEYVRFTVNLGIFVPAIAEAEGRSFSLPPTEMYCHWRRRLGYFGYFNRDQWWIVSEPRQALSALREIGLLLPRVMAFFDEIDRASALLAYWKRFGLEKLGPPRSEYVQILERVLP